MSDWIHTGNGQRLLATLTSIGRGLSTLNERAEEALDCWKATNSEMDRYNSRQARIDAEQREADEKHRQAVLDCSRMSPEQEMEEAEAALARARVRVTRESLRRLREGLSGESGKGVLADCSAPGASPEVLQACLEVAKGESASVHEALFPTRTCPRHDPADGFAVEDEVRRHEEE
jgi:hypothetical protein